MDDSSDRWCMMIDDRWWMIDDNSDRWWMMIVIVMRMSMTKRYGHSNHDDRYQINCHNLSPKFTKQRSAYIYYNHL